MMTTDDCDQAVNADEYNGWSNRETWAASLHLSNDRGLYEMVNGWANDARREALEDAEADSFGFFSNGVATVEHRTVTLLGDKLSDYIAELHADIFEVVAGDHPAEVSGQEVAMVLEIGSTWRVDWYELAENWLEGFEFEDDDQ